MVRPTRELLRMTTAAAVGVFSWSVAEYGLHRFAMHEMQGKGLPSKEHLRHHADVTYFSPASKKAASALGASAIVFPVASVVVGRRAAAAFNGGLIAMYLFYEWFHRRIHTHAPRSEHGRRMRRHHLSHHARNPMRNFGVTSAGWDRVFGTQSEDDVVVLPRRIAPGWLIDERHEVRAEYAADYEVVGRREMDAEQARRDWDRAFANQPPEGLPAWTKLSGD
jgi:hypothetical protein